MAIVHTVEARCDWPDCISVKALSVSPSALMITQLAQSGWEVRLEGFAEDSRTTTYCPDHTTS